MYSLLPALVSALFLGYGIYVLIAKGINRISSIFFIHCITTFFWQGTWALLFQVTDPVLAIFLIKFGYVFILLLPPTLYHFFTEISARPNEHRWVHTSYAIAAILVFFNLTTDLLVDGYYDTFWGYYPKAGLIHPLHVLETVLVVCRGVYITWQQKKTATADQRSRLQICLASMLVYSFAGIDYLCNYGFAIYPPGAIFAAIAVGLLSIAVTKYDLMRPFTVAATVAHEMRTPLATIGMQSHAMAQHLPHLFEGYQRAVAHGLIEEKIDPLLCELLIKMPQKIHHQINRSHAMINMMLASARMENFDKNDFTWLSVQSCTMEALDTYPFTPQERAKVTLIADADFKFYGSESLFIFIIFNLLKNALYAMKSANKGDICITISEHENARILKFTDTATGIAPSVLKRIFDTFYTTKQSAGAGIGLAFCQRAVKSFNGQMRCDSIEGQYTTFTLNFAPDSMAPGSKPTPLVNE